MPTCLIENHLFNFGFPFIRVPIPGPAAGAVHWNPARGNPSLNYTHIPGFGFQQELFSFLMYSIYLSVTSATVGIPLIGEESVAVGGRVSPVLL